MTEWLLSIVGVVFLGVLFDLIYPAGKTNSLCKSIFGIFAMFIMISPILNLDIDKFVSNVSNNDILIENITETKNDTYRKVILSHLEEFDINGVSVEIDSKLNNNNYVIENIFVDSTNLVLTEKVTNINKYEVIADEIAKVVDVERERIIVYG